MGDFKFDVEKAIESCNHAIGVDLMAGQLSLFVVICINEDGESSHGGQVFRVLDGAPTEDSLELAVSELVASAIDTNGMAKEGHTCKYVPIVVGLQPSQLAGLTRQLYGLAGSDALPIVIEPDTNEE